MAPRRPLFGVPSRSIIARSSAAWSAASRPVDGLGDLAVHVGDGLASRPCRRRRRRRRAARRPRTRRSTRPTGTAARPAAPDSSRTSTSTVGLPRLSRICRACTRSISLNFAAPSLNRLAALAQRELRVDVQRPRDARRASNSSSRSADDRRRRLGGVLAGACALRPCARRAAPAGSPAASPKTRAALVVALDRVPVAHHARRPCRPRRVAEHVRVAADQLLAHRSATVGQVARAALLEQQRQEVDLEQHVAELVEQLGVVARVRGVGQLVGLLDRVRDDRALVLLAVPGALAPQPAGDLVERPESVRACRSALALRHGYGRALRRCCGGCGALRARDRAGPAARALRRRDLRRAARRAGRCPSSASARCRSPGST